MSVLLQGRLKLVNGYDTNSNIHDFQHARYEIFTTIPGIVYKKWSVSLRTYIESRDIGINDNGNRGLRMIDGEEGIDRIGKWIQCIVSAEATAGRDRNQKGLRGLRRTTKVVSECSVIALKILHGLYLVGLLCKMLHWKGKNFVIFVRGMVRNAYRCSIQITNPYARR